MERTNSDLAMMRVAYTDAKTRLAAGNGGKRDRAIIAYYRRMTLSEREQSVIFAA
jgi:hypothetical protein